MKAKKRLLSLLLCCAMVFSFCPQASAGGELASPSNAATLSVEDVQKLIDALPTADELATMSLEEQQEVYTKLQAAYDAYNALTEEQKAEVTGAEIFDSLFDVFNGMVNTLADGSITEAGITITYSNGGSATYTEGSGFQITANGDYVISGVWNGSLTASIDNCKPVITILNGVTANITIKDLKMINTPSYTGAFALQGNAVCNLTLEGSNILQSHDFFAGLQVPDSATLTITKESNGSSLEAYGSSQGCAGIGGGGAWGSESGTITIHGGEIKATGAGGGAGIGGGTGGSGGTINIYGGKITATGGGDTIPNYGAGIGGGNGGSGGKITISGNAEVNARSGNGAGNGAGIGGGAYDKGGEITISGNAKVTASSRSGAGIGGGVDGYLGGFSSGGIITITDDAEVEAVSTGSGAGIGGGGSSGQAGPGGEITISGNATVKATGGPSGGAGIGGGGAVGDSSERTGRGGDGGIITISDNANVTAISQGSTSGDMNGISGAAIGGGGGCYTGGEGGEITISSSGEVRVNGAYAPDIGGGVGKDGPYGKEITTAGSTKIEITGSDVKNTNGGDPVIGPVHGQSTGWAYDDTNHWHPCEVSKCTDEAHQSQKEPHSGLDTGAIDNGELVYACEVCEYEKTYSFVDITVTTQPKLKYNAGDTLDLSGLEITVTFGEGGDQKQVKLGYNSEGVKCYMGNSEVTHDITLTTAHNGQTIAVKWNNNTIETEQLTVTKMAQDNHPTVSVSKTTADSITVSASGSGQGNIQYACVKGENASAPTVGWQDSNIFSDREPGTAYTVFARYAGNEYYEPSSASDGVTVYTAAKKPAASEVFIDYKAETISFADTLEVNTAEDFDRTAITSGDSIKDYFGSTLYVRVKENGNIPASEPLPLAIPSRPAAPSVSINYEEETLSTTTAMQYASSTSGQSVQRWETCGEDMAATAFGWDGSAEVTVKFRTAATDSAFASAETIVTIPARPEAPAAPVVTDRTSSSIEVSVVSGQEYKRGEEEWQTPTGSSIIFDGLEAGESYIIYTRVKATASQFASAEASVTTSTEKPGGGGGSSYTEYTITASAGAGGIISPSGKVSVLRGLDKTFTITPDEDYVIADVLIDGKSVGAVSSYTFKAVKQAHTIETVFTLSEEAAEAERNARLKAGVENTTIKLRSTLGKGFIRLNWRKSGGYKVDFYEVFKSKKRYSGYGTKAYFTTKRGGLTGWYKNTKDLKKGTRYYYKVRGVRKIAGEIVYTKWSNKAWRLVK